MAIKKLLLKHFNILKAYFLIILVLALMLFQLNIVSIAFQFEPVLAINHSLFAAYAGQLSWFGMVLLSGLLSCCIVWYCYRPVIIFYLLLKTKFRTLPFMSNFFASNHFNTTSDLQLQYSWILRSVNKSSKKLSIAKPKIVIDPSSDINAKAVPGFFHAPLIILTQGLLNELTADEVEAVVAHELAHIAMNDTYSMSITDLILRVFVWLPVYASHFVIDYALLHKWRSKNIGFILSLSIVLFAYGFFALFFLNTLNRYYELRADKIAMKLVNLQSFVSALQRIHDSQSHAPWVLEWCMASTPKIVQDFVLKIFLSHPSIPSRIQALQ